MRTAILATCTLNQWAMDFSGNYHRILESIKQAKTKGATYRCGPELEITGYGCGDHFHESDTLLHSWEVLIELLKDPSCSDIIVDVGMPVMHKNIVYNCRVLFLNEKILLIRPKTKLCDSWMYRESRWFSAWAKEKGVEDCFLPLIVQKAISQRTAPIGDAILSTSDTTVGFEICEELWNPQSSHIGYAEEGIEIIVNASGGFHEIGTLNSVVKMIQSATAKCGGLYLFSNLRGCDGDRMYYHGTSHITLNGQVLAMGKQFSLQEVEVVTACIDLDDVIRRGKRFGNTQSLSKSYPRVHVDFSISSDNILSHIYHDSVNIPFYEPGEDLTLGPACWLWDCLRRSSSSGFILPLNDDIGSVSSAVIVFTLCKLVYKSINEGDSSVLSDLRSILRDPSYIPNSSKELCNKLLVTFSCQTEEAPVVKSVCLKNFASEIGSCHLRASLDAVINAVFSVFLIMTSMSLKPEECDFKNHPAYFSVKDRIKNVVVYLIAEMFLWSKGRSGNLLVLGTGYAEASLVGNSVKYNGFYGDLSLTAAIGRRNLELLLKYSLKNFKLHSLREVIDSSIYPNVVNENVNNKTEELIQENETETFSKLRRNFCGPYSAFCKLSSTSSDEISLRETADRVKRFFYLHSFHRSKMLATAPSYHVDPLAASNLYLDQRPLFYDIKWTWQFNSIEREIRNRNVVNQTVMNTCVS